MSETEHTNLEKSSQAVQMEYIIVQIVMVHTSKVELAAKNIIALQKIQSVEVLHTAKHIDNYVP